MHVGPMRWDKIMIINTGGRTDTVRYYTEWLLRRFEEGYVLVRNPMFPNKVTRYELTPDKVDAVVFCSKDYEPILPRIHEITDRFPTYFQYTITGYGPDVEPNVPSIEHSMETLIRLSETVGRQRVSWRYDPVLYTKNYSLQTHARTFDRMAGVLSPYVDRCIFSYVELYRKLNSNMPEIIPFTAEDRVQIAKCLGGIAREHGLYLQTCGDDDDLEKYGIHTNSCTTLEILGAANGLKFRNLKHRGMRKGCHCIEWHDIGAYDTCIAGCRYCYANKDHARAFENFKLHDPSSPMLLGNLRSTDELHQGSQKTMLAKGQEPRRAQQQTLDL